MARTNDWQVLAFAGIMISAVACADSREAVAPRTPPAGADQNGTPTPNARAVLACTATLSGLSQPLVTCVTASSGGTAGRSASRARGGRIAPSDVIVGRQNIDVNLALSNFSYSATTGIFQFNSVVTNLLNQPLGTTDGVHSTSTATRVFFYTLPAVTKGVGTVTVNNADGTGFFTQSQPQPYYQYTSPIAPGASTAAKTWQLKITGTVTNFTFAVEVDAALPAEKSIRRWVTLWQGLTNDSLTSVWMRSASDVYAVGLSGSLLEYNGTAWSTVTGPKTTGSTSNNYRAVSGQAGAAVASVWVVGDAGALLHDTAGTWSSIKTRLKHTNLYGVWGASAGTAFAVGSGTAILQVTNGNVNTMSTPGGVSSTLYGTWGSDSVHVWAVGDGGTILFYDGASWVQQSSGTSQTLSGVWGHAATDVFAVGANGTVLHFDGTSWSNQTTSVTAPLSGVGGSSGTDVWAVGENGTTLHYNGSSWSVVGPHTGIPLSSVTAGGATPWAVGAEGSLLSYNGTAWQVSTQSGLSLNAVWAASAADVWVATLGTVLHYNGTGWTNAYVAPGDSMTAIWGTGATDTIYVGGSQGDAAVYAGNSWSPFAFNLHLHSLWGTSSTNVYGGAASATVGHYNGASVTDLSLPSNTTAQGVWGSSASNVIAVTSNGSAYRYIGSGSTWTAMTMPQGVTNLDAVFGSSASDVYAAGTNGSLVHYAGSGSWTGMTSGTNQTLRGVWADSPPSGYSADAYAVGDAGTVQHYNGSAWLNMPTPSSAGNLLAVFGTSASNVYVVGDNGTVLLGTQ